MNIKVIIRNDDQDKFIDHRSVNSREKSYKRNDDQG